MTLDRPAPRRKLRPMRSLIALLLLSSAAFADACSESARPFWSVACSDPRLRAVTLEMEALIEEIRETPGLHPGTWAAHGLRAEMVYQALTDCLGTQDAAACMLPVAAAYVAELRESPEVPAGRVGLSRAPVDLLCPEYARPFRLTQLDTDPALLWMVPPGVLLARDPAARNPVFGGDGPTGTVDLGITPSGQVVLTGLSQRPMPCMPADESVLR